MHTTANQSSVVHSTFSIERTYPVTPSRVFSAFANQETKRRWFAEGTRLVYTEQGAFFDGADKPEGREAGCRELLEKLGEELRKQ